MKKKLVTGALLLAFGATAVTGGTLAYFTDADADRNVMTVGNVYIVQNETDRFGDAYEDEQALLPAVYLKDIDNDGKYETPYNPATTWEGPGGYDSDKSKWMTGEMKNTTGEGTIKIYDDNINNEIDKVISVTNKGTMPAYIRTILLFENTPDNAVCDLLHVAYNNDDGQGFVWLTNDNGAEVQVEIADNANPDEKTTYSIAICTYNTALGAGKTSAPSLQQIWLDPSADNEWYDLLGEDGRYSILAFSQAVQTEGFTSANEALNTAFGEVTDANVLKWLAETPVKTTDFANVVGGN